MERRWPASMVSPASGRGFIFPSSEIYGGLNGFWDYGPLGVELKRNVKESWWRDMVTGHDDLAVLSGAPTSYEMTGIDCTIIMHPQVWKVSGHYDLFHDFMVDCRQSKKRYRHDQVRGRWLTHRGQRIFVATELVADEALAETQQRALKFFNLRGKDADDLAWEGELVSLTTIADFAQVLGPDAKELGTLTPPREFNLMFETYVGAMRSEDAKAFLRPETAQGIFVNFKNVLDSSRVRVPFGIAQMGKSFRNEITPRNFTFARQTLSRWKSSFSVISSQSPEWYRYCRDRRFRWYTGSRPGRRTTAVARACARGAFALFPRHRRHRICISLSGEWRFRRVGGDRSSRRFRPAQPHGRQTQRKGTNWSSNSMPKASDANRGSGKDLSYRDDLHERTLHPARDRALGSALIVRRWRSSAKPMRRIKRPDESGKMQTRVVMRLHPRLRG